MAPDPWFLGGRLSQADVTATATITHMAERRPEMFAPGAYPALAGLREQAEALPAFRAQPFGDD